MIINPSKVETPAGKLMYVDEIIREAEEASEKMSVNNPNKRLLIMTARTLHQTTQKLIDAQAQLQILQGRLEGKEIPPDSIKIGRPAVTVHG